MPDDPEKSVSSSILGIMAGTRRSQAVLRATLFTTLFVVVLVLLFFVSIVIWRVSGGSCVKGFGVEIGCEGGQGTSLDSGGRQAIDLQSIEYSYIYLPLNTGALNDCARVVRDVLRGRGFSAITASPTAWRSTRDVNGEPVTSAVQCATTDNRYYFFGMTFGLNGTLVADESKAIYDMAAALNKQYSDTFTPRGGDIPYFHVSNASFPIQFIATEQECGKFASISLSRTDVFDIVEKPSYSYGSFNGGKIVAFCVRSYDSEEYIIAVGAFGYATEDNDQAVKALVGEMRKRRDEWLADNSEPTAAIEPGVVVEE